MTRIEADKEFTRVQLDMESWWMKNGFNYDLIKRGKRKDVYTVKKDGITMKYEIRDAASDLLALIADFQKLFEVHSMSGRA